ncbi:DUF5946 family protein [Streptomyces sp. NBC_00237]|uniref:DUF5946 family protein n=1 Tax=Streptomyces sp. NBC_00237 TaxID=2975687 RepID=UPI00224F0D94|nr:DUF5946 family protein [Streptomyces sp. NBC_00237]MCX5206482.1 DUF5946 family protein [Streptomyces sp. NBC_00237]
MAIMMTSCPGCGLAAPATGGPLPAERVASAECWQRYGELLARSYTVADCRHVHQLVVDSYVAQHAGGESRREIQTVALCLMTLCLFVEDDADPREGPALHRRMMADRPAYFHWLEPPPQIGLMTAADVLAARDAVEHERLVRAWSRGVWRAWAPHHATIRGWNARALTRPDTPDT